MGYNLNTGEIERRASLIAAVTNLPMVSSQVVAEKLLTKKTVAFEDVLSILDGEWDMAGRACGSMASAGLLRPMKNAHSIRCAEGEAVSRYRVCFPTIDASEANALDSSITRGNPSLFATHPWLYIEHADDLKLLSKWLRSTYGVDVEPVSEGERAYEIWGDEKKLLDGNPHKDGFRELLARLRFDTTLLRTYSTSQSLFRSYLLPATGRVVVSENLDFYCSMKKLLRAGPIELFGAKIAGSIFGSGAAAVSPAFDQYLAAEEIADGRLLYVGDIDTAGLSIAQNFAAKHGDVLFYPLYEEMARRHVLRRNRAGMLFHYPESQARGGIDEEAFLANLYEDAAHEVSRCLAEKVRIPQEIITLGTLKELIDAN